MLIRFPGEVQGKELEDILKGEGVIEPDEEEEIDENLGGDDEELEVDLQLVQAEEDESQKGSEEETTIGTIVVKTFSNYSLTSIPQYSTLTSIGNGFSGRK